MREIKFRLIDTKTDVRIDPKEFFITDSEVFIYYSDFDNSEKADMRHHVILQCTGLKDKNGVEIYEGDILNGVYYGETELDEKNKGEVYYTNRGTWDCCSFLLGDLNETCEVIGNIYNN